MFKLNKKIFLLFLLFFVVSAIAFFEYKNTGGVQTKWGDFHGESGLHVLIAYWFLTGLFAFFSVRKNKNPDRSKKRPKNDRRF